MIYLRINSVSESNLRMELMTATTSPDASSVVLYATHDAAFGVALTAFFGSV